MFNNRAGSFLSMQKNGEVVHVGGERRARVKDGEVVFFFFFRRLFPTQEWRRGRNFGEIDGAMYRDDERAPIFPRKSGRNLEKRGDPRKFGSDGSIPWLSSSLKKFSPTIILMKMAARVPRFPASVFFF